MTAPSQAAPVRGWLDDYSVDIAAGDLFGDATPALARVWERSAARIAQLGEGDPAAVQDIVARNVAELGLSFRVPGDADERDWPLTAMPLIVRAGEWEQVERGLVQRAELFERLAGDIYGPRTLVRDGHLPAPVIAGSPYFARAMLGRAPREGHFVQVYAADLARGPRGQWRVLQDRVRLATGIGYALENRLAMLRTNEGSLAEGRVRRHAEFFAAMRDGMAAACRRELPRIALMTPGRFNQSYAEQAHLARYLGFPLVEGRDLSVLEERLYVGTIAGPKRVDAVWRWIDTQALDPLTFDARSRLGVAGLFDAWDAGGVEMFNWPGAEVFETPAFAAFLPRLCQVLTGEDPILPTVATWWCGQEAEASIVRERLDELALIPAFRRSAEGFADNAPIAGAHLSSDHRRHLLEAIARRPMDYCGQEIVNLSTTPAIVDGRIEPRPFTVRAFLARGRDGGWTVMPGGFARISSSSSALPTSMIGAGDVSADVWIVEEPRVASAPASLIAADPPISRGGGLLASQAADNLFWFGRYNERAEGVVRLVKALLGAMVEAEIQPEADDHGVLGRLSHLLAWSGAVQPATTGPDRDITQLCAQALAASSGTGNVPALLRRRQEVGRALRDRFAGEVWRLVSAPMPAILTNRPQAMLAATRVLTQQFSALAGLIAENMVRGHAWRFLELGQRIERAQSICRTFATLTAPGAESDACAVPAGAAALLLDMFDSHIVYRSRYLAAPLLNPVRDLVLLDPDNPRALVFQTAQIVLHLEALPVVRDDNLPETPLRLARKIHADLQSAEAQVMTATALADFETRLLELSDAISTRYFLTLDRDDAERRTRVM